MKRLDWGEIIRLVDVEGLDYAEAARRLKKTTAAIRNAYVNAKQHGWTEDGPPEGTQENVIPDVIPVRMTQFNDEEIDMLREIIQAWQAGKNGNKIPDVIHNIIPKTEGPKSRRTWWIEDSLYGKLKAIAEQRGVSQAAVVNTVLRTYLKG